MAKKYAKGYTPDDKVQEVAAKPEEEKKEKVVASNAADLGIATMAEPAAEGSTEVVTPPSSTDKTEDVPEEVTEPEDPSTDPEGPEKPGDDEEEPGEDDDPKQDINWAQVCCAMTVYPKLS